MSKVVILGDVVGTFEKGRVIPESKFHSKEEIGRLMALGVIRPAREDEFNKEIVDAKAPPASSFSAHQQLASAHSNIDHLRLENHKLKEQLENLQTVPPDYDPMKDQKIDEMVKNFQTMVNERDAWLRERDELIESLRKQLQEKADASAAAVSGGKKKG
jgi:predicted RNase H-like nuclease (RuvC/YqgF family)